MSHESREITDEFLAQLKEDLVCRRVGRGMARLQDHQELFTSFDPEQKNAALFAGYLAQWVDIGFQRPALVKEIVSRFSKSIRARLPLQDYLYLRLAEGMVAMAAEATEEAIPAPGFCAGSRRADRRQGTAVDRQFLEGPLPAHEGRVRSGAGLRGKGQGTGHRTRPPADGCRHARAGELALLSERERQAGPANPAGGRRRP